MENGYWIAEYGKVLFGYLFLMFLWPSVVFGGHLKKKTKTYRFSFCVTTQVVIINTVVLGLGLLHILTRQAVMVVFYGVFVAALIRKIVKRQIMSNRLKKDWSSPSASVQKSFRSWLREGFLEARWKVRTWVSKYGVEYGTLAVVVIFGMLYFSYGAFQVHSYGSSDMYVHHEWIYGLVEGRIFSDGVYPEAMHCFIYCLEALFGIRIFSSLLFLQCVHIAVFLISIYIFLKEIFYCRYTPVFALALFLVLDVTSADMIFGMYRLQITFPLEFGLYTVFLCAAYLIRYLENGASVTRKGKASRCYWDENLFLFIMALAASIMIHFYATMLAFVLCVSFAIFAVKKIFKKEYLIPLVAAVMCGIFIAIMPMAGALVSGIPFNYSIDWAVNTMDGSESRELKDKEKNASDEKQEDNKASDEKQKDSKASGEQQEDNKMPDKNGETGEENNVKKQTFEKNKGKLAVIYEEGYVELYGHKRAVIILSITGAVVLFCLVSIIKKNAYLKTLSQWYLQVVLFTLFFILLYTAPYIGLPEFISIPRLCSVGHLMILVVMAIPVDIIFSFVIQHYGCFTIKILSLVSVAGVYVAAVLSGNYHGFLFYELTRQDAAVSVTNSIIDSMSQKGWYVIVAPTDELYPIIQYGGHVELLTFVKSIEEGDYTIPAEHVFIYVEKKPLSYGQSYFFDGSSWLGEKKYMEIYREVFTKRYPDRYVGQAPEIKVSQISKQAAGKDLAEQGWNWQTYTMLENRTALESKAYEWCQRFQENHPSEMKVYYEDEDFVCYYFRQNPGEYYNLGME